MSIDKLMIPLIAKVLYIDEQSNDCDTIIAHIRRVVLELDLLQLDRADILMQTIEEYLPDLIVLGEDVFADEPEILSKLHYSKLDIPIIVLSNDFEEEKVGDWYSKGVLNVVCRNSTSRLERVLNNFIKSYKTTDWRERLNRLYGLQNNRFKELIEVSRTVMWQMVLHPMPHLSYVNPAFEELTEYTREELYNNISLLFNIFSPEINPKVRILSGDTSVPLSGEWEELIGKTKSGTTFYVSVRALPVYDNSKRMVGLQGVCFDISKIKVLERNCEERQKEQQNLLDTIPDFILLIDSEGNIFKANQAVCRATGFEKEELQQMHWSDFVDGEGKDFKDIYQQLLRKGNEEYQKVERLLNAKIGYKVPIEMTLNVIQIERELCCVFTGRDLTYLKIKNESLALKESMYRQIFSNHAGPQVLISLSDFRIVEANQAAADLYKFPLSTLGALTIYDIAPYSKEEVDENMKVFAQSSTLIEAQKHCRADGEIIYVELYASPISVNGDEYVHYNIFDATQKTEAAQQLKLFKRVIEEMPAILVVTDNVGNIEYVNPAFTKVTGYTAAEAIGNTPRLYKSDAHSVSFYENMWETILSGNIWISEIQNRRKDGSYLWERSQMFSITDEYNQITHFVSVKEDITEQKEIRQKLMTEMARAQESDRLKSAFLNNISHEIRTPLNGIVGFIDLLFDSDIELEESQKKEFVDLIKQSGKRLISTITNIVEVSKIETGESVLNPTKVELKVLFEELNNKYRNQIKDKGLEFELTNFKDSKEFINTDYSKLNLILDHLLDNAIKFTNEGTITLGFAVFGDYIQFSVKDTGIGISESMQEHIFDNFNQADAKLNRDYEGVGLGLSIVKHNASILGGEITCESELGQGSTFYLMIKKG